MRLLICGDLHASWLDLNSVMKNVDFNLNIKYDAVIQVGDFGFYASEFEKLDKSDLKMVNGKYEQVPLKFHKKVIAIVGNHEDHVWLSKVDKEAWKDKYNIFFQERGSWIDIDGYKIGFLGGALNADRVNGGSIDKETTNYILDKQVKRAIKAWNDVSGMDTIITHSCPTGMGVGMQGHPALIPLVQQYIVDAGFGENDFNDCGEHPLTDLYKGLNNKPQFWFLGHFHVLHQKKIDNTEFICVGSTDSSDGRHFTYPIILDTKTGKYEFHNKKALNFTGEHSTRLL